MFDLCLIQFVIYIDHLNWQCGRQIGSQFVRYLWTLIELATINQLREDSTFMRMYMNPAISLYISVFSYVLW